MATVKKVSDRLERANKLKQASIVYWAHKGYACTPETGVLRRGKRRADVLAINWYSRIVLIEVKSCIADLRADTKMHLYLPLCNAMYLVIGLDTWTLMKKKGYDKDLPEGCGILALGPSGLLRSVKKAKSRPLASKVLEDLKMRLIFKSVEHTKRKTRKTRIYL